ncbi:NAD(P)/FAD-dependent oxidoreductase [Amycolatopsis saalfeldensis]|uniref:NAD(P)/FAD-dependent oxidoreductase n=1 Tax=Amycolatopsis saalfeldensis TaxID=394193 RepID=UPI002481A12C|nr:FAD-binding oxidoreductase [Amycolatopsis saalfeldensis]
MLIVGAGVVGAACAYFCAAAGLRVAVLDRGGVAGGTTSGGEGNILVSDKSPSPELDLALLSTRLWGELGERFGPGAFELEHKGGVVVAQSPEAARGLAVLTAKQRGLGVEAVDVSAAELAELEPNLTPEVCAGAFYPQDMQVQPMLAAAELLRAARALGATLHTDTEVLAFRLRDGSVLDGAALVGGTSARGAGAALAGAAGNGPASGGRASAGGAGVGGAGGGAALGGAAGNGPASGGRTPAGRAGHGSAGPGAARAGSTAEPAALGGVVTNRGEFGARWVVNAAGTWGGPVSALAGAPIPVLPRRGFVLVTEPLPRVVRHKVYTADYVANVASGDAGLETSVVVEGTRAGTVLIGASRERVGFDRQFSLPIVRKLAAQALGVFPFLADVALLRGYFGFRPYCPDHLPVIGVDPRRPGLVHACGHEGAGIGLAAATGHLIAQQLTGATPDLDLTPFRADRFSREAV